MKKRILSMALALALVLSLCVPALAEEEPATEPSGDAAPTQRLKEVHSASIGREGDTSEDTLAFSYGNGGTLPLSVDTGLQFTYDEAGHILSDGQFDYTYDEEGRLIESRTGSFWNTYQYDEKGRLQVHTTGNDNGPGNEETYNYSGPYDATVSLTVYADGSAETYDGYARMRFDDSGRVVNDGQRAYCYSPQLKVGYCDPDLAAWLLEVDPDLTTSYDSFDFSIDVLDAAGTTIVSYRSYNWVPPVDMTYDDAGYLIHAESSNGCTADFTYEPIS